MTIACLIAEDATYAALRPHLLALDPDCERFNSDVALMRGLSRRPVAMVLADLGHDRAQHERLIAWMDCRTVEDTPVVLRMADAGSQRVAEALEAGAADVVSRNADPAELIARARAVMRRHRRTQGEAVTVNVAGFELDRTGQKVCDRGVPVELTTREFSLAWLLFSNAGKCLSRNTIAVAVWGVDEDISSRTMEQHIYRLRRKLQLNESRGVTIRTAYGQGYKLDVCPDELPTRVAVAEPIEVVRTPEPRLTLQLWTMAGLPTALSKPTPEGFRIASQFQPMFA